MTRFNIAARNRNQSGYTLIEVILGIALVGMLSAGLAVFLVQTIQESARSQNRMQAIMQVENVGYWVTRDVQMTENVTIGLGAGYPLTLEWKDKDDNMFQITYSLTQDQIKRSFVKNGQQTSFMIVANSVNSDPTLTNCVYTDGLLVFNVTTRLRNVNISRTYQIKKRLDLL